MSSLARLADIGGQRVVRSASTAETEPTVCDFMLRHPKTLSAHASITQARAALSNDHVHLVLLTEGDMLVGTLTRTDLPPTGTIGPALAWSTLVDRTASPDTLMSGVHVLLTDGGLRRLAVVGDDGALLGLICLKQGRTGFCSDAGVEARSSDPLAGS